MDSDDYFGISQKLVAVAMGREAADIVFRDTRWICVQSGEIIPHTDIAVSGEWIAFVGPDARHTIGSKTQVINFSGLYASPGLIDGHMHIESGMLTISEFVRAVIPHGTTAMMADPHEIANVFGLKGIKLMVDEALVQPIHVWMQVPSCVPSAPGFETPGASLGPQEVAEALSWDGIIGLGEVMNFPGVFLGDQKMHAEMAEARKFGKVIGGHYASPDLGIPFHGYAAGGPEDDHEGTRVEDAITRIRQGMKAMLRLGSAWHDVAAQVEAITKFNIDSRHFILCSDDSHSETLVNEGHVNRAVKEAISCGVPPITAIQMATINPAEHFGLAKRIGMIAPGRYADLLFLSDLSQLKIEQVYAKGKLVVSKGEIKIDIPSYEYPGWAVDSVHIGRKVKSQDFKLATPLGRSSRYLANVIGVIENQAPNRHLKIEIFAQNGEVHPDFDRDIAKVAIVERHSGAGRIQVGLVQGFGLNVPCAIASTVAHDCHQMVVVGTNDQDMAMAVNQLAKIGGGQIVVQNQKVIGQLDLPIAGIMSNDRAENVANKAKSILNGFKACGCRLNNPNIQLSFLALVVIPELRLSDLGLIDVKTFRFIPVLEEIP